MRTRRKYRGILVAAFLAVVACLAVWRVVITARELDPGEGTRRIFYAEHLYWERGVRYYTIPESWQQVSTVMAETNDEEEILDGNSEAYGLPVGSKIYMHPDRQNVLYVYNPETQEYIFMQAYD